MGLEPRGRADQGKPEANSAVAGEEPLETPKPKVKSFEIDKRLMYQAWEKVRANQGAPGVDAVSIGQFGERERDNLYKLWNRMSSGSYFPGPVRAVEIPKDHGKGVRVLGVPNVADRVAQTAAAMLLEAALEPIFHPDSYGYRPGRSAHDALAVCRRRCWEKDWVLDCDIRAFFDSVPHDLLMKAVAHHTSERWVLLYIARWLKAPMQMPDRTVVSREKGTPQGSPISPVLANLFMHYAFDKWMDREHPDCPFERYADDIVAHCDTEEQAQNLRVSMAERLESLGLELHPEKTKVVLCKDANRPGRSEHVSFDFLGYTFRGRLAKGPYGYFAGFSPAISAAAKQAKGLQIRAWHLSRRTSEDLSSIAAQINPVVRGWINYYGAFYRSELRFLAWRINEHLTRWATHKFKRFRKRYLRAMEWLQRICRRDPKLFAHWQLVAFTNGRTVGAG
jgi:RNA-directed DNA polymerase